MIRQTYIGSATALASLLAACAVGPNFKTPQAPQTPPQVSCPRKPEPRPRLMIKRSVLSRASIYKASGGLCSSPPNSTR